MKFIKKQVIKESIEESVLEEEIVEEQPMTDTSYPKNVIRNAIFQVVQPDDYNALDQYISEYEDNSSELNNEQISSLLEDLSDFLNLSDDQVREIITLIKSTEGYAEDAKQLISDIESEKIAFRSEQFKKELLEFLKEILDSNNSDSE